MSQNSDRKMLELNKIYYGDWIELAKQLEDESIDMIMTSPPYWGLCDYQVDGQLGLESHPNIYIKKLVKGFRILKEKLKKTGSLYLNLGDTYFGSGQKYDGLGTKNYSERWIGEHKKRPTTSGFKSNWLQPKQLMLMPSRVAIALQEDGWILRNDIIWHKPNPMPSSVKDRLNTTYEHVFHFVRNRKYFYDLDAIREKPKGEGYESFNRRVRDVKKGKIASSQYKATDKELKETNKLGIKQSWAEHTGQSESYHGIGYHPKGKNPGDVFKTGLTKEAQRLYNHEHDVQGYHLKGKNPGDVLSPKYTNNPEGHSNRQGLNREIDLVTIKAYKEYQEPIAKFLKSYIRKEDHSTLNKVFGKHKWRHWIRTDFSGAALPGVKDWWELKEILKFDNTFDNKIKEITELNVPIFQSNRNPGDIFTINTKPFPEAHFAVYPEKICEKPIKSSYPLEICDKCGFIREKIIKVERNPTRPEPKKSKYGNEEEDIRGGQGIRKRMIASYWAEGITSCSCNSIFSPGIVLDPFIGSGTTALVALKLNRNFIGFEINPDYVKIAMNRIKPYLEQSKIKQFV